MEARVGLGIMLRFLLRGPKDLVASSVVHSNRMVDLVLEKTNHQRIQMNMQNPREIQNNLQKSQTLLDRN